MQSQNILLKFLRLPITNVAMVLYLISTLLLPRKEPLFSGVLAAFDVKINGGLREGLGIESEGK